MGLVTPAHAAGVNVTTTITDPAGNPIEGSISAYALGGDGSYNYVDSQFATGGVVNLPVEPGTYKFSFDDFSGRHVSEWYTDKADMATADAVAVTGPTALAPVQLAVNPIVTGTVVDDTGRPLSGARVTAYDAATGDPTSVDETDRTGVFTLGAAVGNYKLEVDGVNDYAGEWYNNKVDEASADPIAVPAAGVNVGAITLTEGTTVSGTVTGNAGVPLERARVEIYRPADSFAFESDLTDAAGNFTLEGVEPGSYKLRFSDPVGEYLTEWYADKGDQATADAVVVAKDTPLAGIAVNLAPDPAAAIDPATVDLTGAVVDSSGKPVVGAQVEAESTPLNEENRSTDQVRTNRAGIYAFTDLDPAASGQSEDTFKVSAYDPLEREEGQFYRLSSYFGGAKLYDNADSVVLTPGAAKGGVNITLPLTGGVSGTITSESGLPVSATYASFINSDSFGGDQAGAKSNGTYQTTALTPGTYKVLFGDSGVGLERHAPEWYNNARFEDAKTITVKSGQMVTGINAALNEDLRAVKKPEIKGKPYVNGTVRATPGEWTLSEGTTYRYEWLIGSAVVGSGSTYKLSKSNMGDRITLRVTAENAPYDGQALVTSQVIKKQPKVKIKAHGKSASIAVKVKGLKAKKIKGSVTAREIVKVKANGEPKYKKLGKAKITNGKGHVSLAKLKGKGKHKVVFTFKFKGKVGNIEITKKIK
ncbi:carboxypeptidase regulatory-like domain-containing protein [Nocardioides sp. LHG3406-4]|uniref:carboxypeptidase regulatory-like domain-containing protein n=1 Tax=Nocardioides sp. LHG3406-4 TaxID=2804575 RepID=UPI003CF70895